jgi:hypothetical protein
MPELSSKAVAKYLSDALGRPVKVQKIHALGGRAKNLKDYTYGLPLRVEYSIANRRRAAVLHTIRPGPFGHEHMADRAREILWSHRAFNHLPNHVRSLTVGAFLEDGGAIALGRAEEFFLLTNYADGREYASDLARIRRTGDATKQDFARAGALCEFLSTVHRNRVDNPSLYLRRIRELVGDHQCIFGLSDSYPEDSALSPAMLKAIEHHCIDWRWKQKRYSHRLSQAHGDFHPWNILFSKGTRFTLLDRSRGEYDDPAGDVTALTLNYVFFSLQRSGRLKGAFERLFRDFWDSYVEQSGDTELFQVAAPFFAFRALVMASPIWYPKLDDSVRAALGRFIVSTLDEDTLDPAKVNQYCGV